MKQMNKKNDINKRQEEIDESAYKWQAEHPGEVIRPIVKLNDIPIKGEKPYYATKSGFIISFKRPKPRVLQYTRASDRKNGYAQVSLSVDGREVQVRVQRVIMETFEDKKPFFPDRKKLNIPITEYDAHHIENKMIDPDKYADILSDKSEEDKQKYANFLDNSLDNIKGIKSDIHYKMFNELSTKSSINDSIKYMQNLSSSMGVYAANDEVIMFNGVQYKKDDLNNGRVGGAQDIRYMSKDNPEEFYNFIRQELSKMLVIKIS